MNITFISPKQHEKGLSGLYVFNRMPQLGIYRLASQTPKEWGAEVIDENIHEIDFTKKTDLVAISTITSLAPRAYRIADEYRKRGVPVIIGGIHASYCPDEAASHADSIFIGEADDEWVKVLEDFANNSLKKFYRAVAPPTDLRGEFLVEVPYNIPFISAPIIQTSRGCPIGCDFCSVSIFNGRKIRHRSIKKVVEEISLFFDKHKSRFRYLIFSDDNIVADRDYAYKLFKALEPLKLRWLSQADVRIGQDDELLEAAVKSGLTAVFMGLETIEEDQLKEEISSAKAIWSRKYQKLITKLHEFGVIIEAGFIFGLDSHNKDIFKTTVDWAIKNKIDIAQFSILTPLPGTKLFERLEAEDRIIAKNNLGKYEWDKFTAAEVVFEPKNMSAKELQQGLDWAYRYFYRYSSIIARVGAKNHKKLLNYLATILVNFSFRKFKSRI